jgi:hypothetical protein
VYDDGIGIGIGIGNGNGNGNGIGNGNGNGNYNDHVTIHSFIHHNSHNFLIFFGNLDSIQNAYSVVTPAQQRNGYDTVLPNHSFLNSFMSTHSLTEI